MKNSVEEKMNLFEWIKQHHSDDEMRNLFINMDIALKYIHEHGYSVKTFYPSKICVLYDNINWIKFEDLIRIIDIYPPKDEREVVQDDLFRSSLIQIGLYANILNQLTPNSLRENFDDIARFIPEGDVPYYRGIVQRGASVYLSEFAVERQKRDLVQLEKQLNESEGKKKSSNESMNDIQFQTLSNDRENDRIYGLNINRDAAFVNYLILPTIILLCLTVIGMLLFVFSIV